MNNSELMNNYENDEDDDSPLEENNIRWSNLLFLPFHPVVKLLVLLSVIIKSILGCIKCEYHNEKGELIKEFYKPGDILAFTSAFLGKPSLKTYSANTDCEILFINITEFFNIMRRYPGEHARYEDCSNEFKSGFEKIIQNHVKKHKDMPYYDKRGLLIKDKRACIKHYLVRGFLMDVIGVAPFYELFMLYLSKDIEDNDALLINTLRKFAHLYLVMGYFDYLADTPTLNMAYLMRGFRARLPRAASRAIIGRRLRAAAASYLPRAAKAERPLSIPRKRSVNITIRKKRTDETLESNDMNAFDSESPNSSPKTGQILLPKEKLLAKSLSVELPAESLNNSFQSLEDLSHSLELVNELDIVSKQNMKIDDLQIKLKSCESEFLKNNFGK
ncbi:unnamed protein product [Parnassius apollo]|uniref:(apollo) hypothetical protein n=1 Tax=Parnassius apollo TaxID=110799 RepID=A0A8S3W4U4_PARAO|nr:unnamed protein product [Parnassius apollo]